MLEYHTVTSRTLCQTIHSGISLVPPVCKQSYVFTDSSNSLETLKWETFTQNGRNNVLPNKVFVDILLALCFTAGLPSNITTTGSLQDNPCHPCCLVPRCMTAFAATTKSKFLPTRHLTQTCSAHGNTVSMQSIK